MGNGPDDRSEDDRKAGFKPRLFAVIALVVAGIAILGFSYLKLSFHKSGPTDESRIVFITPGLGLNQAASLLFEEGVISDAFVFKVNARFFEDKAVIKAGEYDIPASASMAEIYALLQSGEVILHRFTVTEGQTVGEVVDALDGDQRFSGSLDVQTIEEGSLLPETYFFSRGDARQDLIRRMQSAMDDALTNAWAQRQEDLPLGTPRDALILASIIEKETGLAEERGLVAGVFINRLRRNIRLQSDPTVVYGISKGRLNGPITVRDLDSDTPYNTYRIRGLPVGPIANPGVDSLMAAVNPEETDAFYFVADGKGGHAFAKTLDEHNANVRVWRRIEAERRRAAKEAAQ